MQSFCYSVLTRTYWSNCWRYREISSCILDLKSREPPANPPCQKPVILRDALFCQAGSDGRCLIQAMSYQECCVQSWSHTSRMTQLDTVWSWHHKESSDPPELWIKSQWPATELKIPWIAMSVSSRYVKASVEMKVILKWYSWSPCFLISVMPQYVFINQFLKPHHRSSGNKIERLDKGNTVNKESFEERKREKENLGKKQSSKTASRMNKK